MLDVKRKKVAQHVRKTRLKATKIKNKGTKYKKVLQKQIFYYII